MSNTKKYTARANSGTKNRKSFHLPSVLTENFYLPAN